MERLNTSTVTYDAGDGFRVDIAIDEDTYEVYLYHCDYRVKSLVLSRRRYSLMTPEGIIGWTVPFLDSIMEEQKGRYKDTFMSPWRSVKDNPPAPGDFVLVMSGRVHVDELETTVDGKQKHWRWLGYPADGDHWMPCPPRENPFKKYR